MTWFLFDDWTMASVYIQCESWEHAEQVAAEQNLTLIGEYVGTRPGPIWLTVGETLH